MPSWGEFASSHAALAAFGAGCLARAPAYIATVRPDGRPRVHPVAPVVTAHTLFLFMEPTSPKGRDLLAGSGFALHSGVPDNAGTGGEFHVHGTARLIDDSTLRADASHAAAFDVADRWVLFELLVMRAVCNGYGDVELPEPRSWANAAEPTGRDRYSGA
jgi:hypothetical protein